MMNVMETKAGRGKRAVMRLLAPAILCAIALAAASSTVRAHQPPAGTPDGFVPVENVSGQEQIPAAPLVIGAYAVAWVLVFGYLWSIWRRLGRVERELADVSRRVAGGARR
jgi:CcmD family protein